MNNNELIFSVERGGAEIKVYRNGENSFVGSLNGRKENVTASKVQGKYVWRFSGAVTKEVFGKENVNVLSKIAEEIYNASYKKNKQSMRNFMAQKRNYLGIGE